MTSRDETHSNTLATGSGDRPHYSSQPEYYGPAQGVGSGVRDVLPPAGGYGPMYFTDPHGAPQKSRKGMWVAIGILATIALVAIGALVFLLLNEDETEVLQDTGDSALISQRDGAPSREEVQLGLEKFMTEGFLQSGTTPEELSLMVPGGINFDAFYTCIVDEIYDDVTVDTLTAIAGNDHVSPITGQDSIVMTSAGDICFRSFLE